MADLLATTVMYHADEFVGPVFAMDPVVVVITVYTNSFVTFLSWIYWLGTHAFNAAQVGQ